MALIDKMAKRNGRLIKEDGTFFNEADALYFQQKYNPFYQTVNNGATVISTRFTHNFAQDGDEYYFALEVPAGRVLTLYFRQLVIQAGEYYIDVMEADSHTGGRYY